MLRVLFPPGAPPSVVARVAGVRACVVVPAVGAAVIGDVLAPDLLVV